MASRIWVLHPSNKIFANRCKPILYAVDNKLALLGNGECINKIVDYSAFFGSGDADKEDDIHVAPTD